MSAVGAASPLEQTIWKAGGGWKSDGNATSKAARRVFKS